MKIKCPVCGEENYFTGLEDEDAKFCSNCNTPIGKPVRINRRLLNENRRNQKPNNNTCNKAEETANKGRQTEEQIKKCENSFFWKYGGSIVYIIFFVGFFLNGGIAIYNFLNEQWLFTVWALLSIFILPKAILGFILNFSYLVLHNPLVFINMPQIMWKLFPGTMQKYRRDSLVVFYNPMVKGLIKEIILIIVSLVPITIFILQNNDILIK